MTNCLYFSSVYIAYAPDLSYHPRHADDFMNLKTTLKQPAPKDSTRFVSRYLDEIIDYGGLAASRAEAILDMQQLGLTQGQIDRWLQGYDLGCRICERHAEQTAVSVKMILLPPRKRRVKSAKYTPSGT